MSVLLVTDDVDDETRHNSLVNPQDFIYKQLKELEYDLSLSISSFSLVESSISISDYSNTHYRQHRRQRRRRCRPQQCLVQHLLTYMITLLVLTNHLHWPVIFLSLSSIKIMSTHASTTTPTLFIASTHQTIIKRPQSTPSTRNMLLNMDEQKCLPIDVSLIDRICSKTCRAPRTPLDKTDDINQLLSDTHFLPFCSRFLNLSIVKENFLNETTQNECRETLTQILKSDADAQKASALFDTYMKSIDSASKENRYSIIHADCGNAYRTWACSVKIPFYYQNHLIPPCQNICDEVERVCPTFRPSDHEPYFAGQPLFFCNGGIVSNSDYGQRPHCFDSCHLFHGSLQRPSSLATLSTSNDTTDHISSVQTFIERIVTTPKCFEIKPLTLSSSSEQTISSLIFTDKPKFDNRSNASLSSSAITIISPSWLSIILILILRIQWKFLQEL